MKTDFQENPNITQKGDLIDLKALIFKYLQYWPILLGCMMLGYFSASIYNKFGVPVYNVMSTVLITEENSSMGENMFSGTFSSFGSNWPNLENEIGILKSYNLAEETIAEMDINVSYFKKDYWKMEQLYGNLPVYVKVDWEREQIVGGLFKLEVIDENNFELNMGGNGISNMYSRSKESNGSISITSRLEGGSAVQFSIMV